MLGISKGLAMYVFLFALISFLPVPAVAQGEGTLNIEGMTAKLWWVIAITRALPPQLHEHVILEAPDRDRITLNFRENAQRFVEDDVLAFTPKTQAFGDIPRERWEEYFIPRLVTFGKTRWWIEWFEYEGQSLGKRLQPVFEQNER